MKPHFWISPLILLIILQTSSAFPRFFDGHNFTDNFPNLTFPVPTPWDTFRNFSGCRLGEKRDGLAQIKQYFKQFGYLPNSTANYTDEFDDLLEQALKIYQQNFNLNETGILDDLTLAQITLPRCGVADVINGTSTMKSGTGMKYSVSGDIHSVGHYSFFPSQPRWPTWNRDLTYAFEPGNQLTDPVKAVFRSAFAKWAEVTTLTFSETDVYSTADITIGFYGGDHGDGEPFDGVLGTLAHAFSPPDGRFHLDDAENWVVDGDVSTSSLSGAVDLESVAVHEIGHLLGMGHSSVESAIMFPTISTGLKKVDLASDDIEGIQVLYGANPNFSGADPTQTPSNQEKSDGGVQCSTSILGVMGMVVGGALLML